MSTLDLEGIEQSVRWLVRLAACGIIALIGLAGTIGYLIGAGA